MSDRLRLSIERQIVELSAEAKRLQAALRALDVDDTSQAFTPADDVGRSTTRRQKVARDAAQHSVLELPPAEQRRNIPGIINATLHADGVATDRMVDDVAGAAGSVGSAPVTGVDRALQELRSELIAVLRNGRN
jgi:hypothetical protein